MASSSVDDQHTNFKHFCRVCKKGYMCGRALGGHMRAHGIGDDTGNLDYEDPESDWEDKQGTKRMYALRTNPNRLKSCRVCENCGKEFLSWKSFLEHKKCGSDDGESPVSFSPMSEADEDDRYDDENQGLEIDYNAGTCASGWLKRKRSFRAKVSNFNSNCPSSEDEDLVLAKCLMDLSNARVDPIETDIEDSLYASPITTEQPRHPIFSTTFLTPFTRPPPPLDNLKSVARTPKGMFECKACKKVFNSHQALGGHRASHKKVKGCFAARNDQLDDNNGDEDVITHDESFPFPKPISSYQFKQGPSTAPPPLVGAARRKSKVHKCSICNRIFASGQALGGHKRCHWLTSNMSDHTSTIAKFNLHQHIEQLHHQALALPNKSKALDLNLSAPDQPHHKYPLSFEVSTEINLRSWNVDHENNVVIDGNKRGDQQLEDHDHKNRIINQEKEGTIEDDEAHSKLKLAKLSELKEISNIMISGSSSSWLQVGIGSKTEVGPSHQP
ncbi:zinc finger protein ZAT9-like [Rutidosis leptorrhynchoides]|uniref:zinc finger protein ZAT9-like n=1 Tax=Rutidosis leptorrhynchoides TaxID=125765 RepID=UPI003A992B44